MAKEVKNGTSKLHTCNGAKLAKILEIKGLNARKLSTELRYNATYLPKVIRSNKIGETAIGLLLSKGIKPSQYDVDMERTVKSKDPVLVADIFDSLPEETKDKMYSEVEDAIDAGIKRNSGRYPWDESEKSPAEKAMEEPGVVRLEFTIDIVKLKAIVKQAVKEAYDEI